MEEAIRKAKNEYMRAWRKRNKDKVKIYNQNYWAKKAANLDNDENNK